MYTMSELGNATFSGWSSATVHRLRMNMLLRQADAMRRTAIPMSCSEALLEFFGKAVALREALKTELQNFSGVARATLLAHTHFRIGMTFPDLVANVIFNAGCMRRAGGGGWAAKAAKPVAPAQPSQKPAKPTSQMAYF